MIHKLGTGGVKHIIKLADIVKHTVLIKQFTDLFPC